MRECACVCVCVCVRVRVRVRVCHCVHLRAQTFSMLAVRVPPTRVESKARELERQCVELQHQQEMQARRVLITD